MSKRSGPAAIPARSSSICARDVCSPLDWDEAEKVLNAFHRGLRSYREGHTPAIPEDEQHRLLRGVLIARSARRINASVVMYNTADFKEIRHFCYVRVVKPTAEFR